MQQSNYNKLLFFLAAIRFILPFFLQHSFYQPHRDEFLYLAEGHHMAWGYMEVPPLLSVFAWLTNLLGGGMFWIKCWPSLFGSFTFFLAGKTVVHLGGRTFAIFLAWLPFVLDGYMRLFYLFQANFLDVFFWSAMAYCLIRYTQTEKNKWLYCFGVCAGLGLMSKYSVAFFAMALLAGLLLTKYRALYLKKDIYISLFIAFLIFLPNLLWQYNHNFPVIHHMKELKEEQLQYINPKDFIISQFLMNFPCVFIWISGLLFVLFNRTHRQYRFVGFAYFIVIGLLIYLSGKSYYAAGVYPILFAFGAFTLEKITQFKWKWTRYAMLAFSILFGLYAFPLILPVFKPQQLITYYEKTHLNKTGDFKWEDLQQHPLPQDFADMMGWKEMALTAGKVYNGLPPEERNRTAVFCNGYYAAGALNYYRKEARLPEAISDNASFLLWLPDKTDIRNILLVSKHLPDTANPVFKQFERITVKDSLTIPLFRETGTKFILCEKGSDSLNSIIEKAIAGLKKQYTRK